MKRFRKSLRFKEFFSSAGSISTDISRGCKLPFLLALQTGWLAQELQKPFPERVKEYEEGIFSLTYSGLVPYKIEAAKTHQQKIADLKNRLARLETLIMKGK